MIAPGIRVVRGPDWIWQNQGKMRARQRVSQQKVSAIMLLTHNKKTHNCYIGTMGEGT